LNLFDGELLLGDSDTYLYLLLYGSKELSI